MRFIERRVGTGVLRSEGSAAATADYALSVWRHLKGPKAGQILSEGRLSADLNILLAALAMSGAMLDLADGRSIAIQITKVEATEALFTAIDLLP